MVLYRQGPCCHPLRGAPYLDLDMVLNKQGSGGKPLGPDGIPIEV
jgi:hypothetical protein